MKRSSFLTSHPSINRFAKSIWLFPVVLIVGLVILTTFKISGSSIGVYHRFFYGGTKDPDLILGRPRDIRSDEWLVDTQMSIAQKNNDFKQVNENIGNGQNLSLLVDAPYKDWSIIFRPHLLGYFILPLDNAFAFRWWFMAGTLIISCYFFVLSILKGRRLFAALVSIALFFSPFIQWWYLYGTLGVIYFAFIGILVFIKLVDERSHRRSILWSLLLAYVATSFILILYPPFQIPVAIATLAFIVGYGIDKFRATSRQFVLQKLGYIAAALSIAGLLTIAYIAPRQTVINTVRNTSYPGKRIFKSGGFDVPHLLSGHLGANMQFGSKANNYSLPNLGLTNRSESSNFVYLTPFLLVPSFYLLYVYFKRHRKLDWSLLAVNSTFLLILAWLFIPGLDILGKVTLLEIVPKQRLLIGLGILNVFQLVLFIRRYLELGSVSIKNSWVNVYTGIVFLVQLGLGVIAMQKYPGFIDIYRVFAFALPVPVVFWLILQKRLELAAGILAVFAFTMIAFINPLYKGTDIITETPVSSYIKKTTEEDPRTVWVTDTFVLENFAVMNGARSLSGVYSYPQLDLWRGVDPAVNEEIYNRYAHVIFSFNRDPSLISGTRIELTGGASLKIDVEPCGEFLQKHSVDYILTDKELPIETCFQKVEEISYPSLPLYIYHISKN